MSSVRVHNLAMSIDGYAAGPNQSLDNPLGEGGEDLHTWIFATPSGREMLGLDAPAGGEGDVELDERFFVAGDRGIGATIMGRNMFGPIRGPWDDETWTGWWGDEPPYHHPVFVLTHHARPSIEMRGGTTFHFVTDGIESALRQATDAAGGADIRIGGGPSVIQQYLRAGLIDEMHVAIVPIVLGGGERLFDNLEAGLPGYKCVELISSPAVAHARFVRSAPAV